MRFYVEAGDGIGYGATKPAPGNEDFLFLFGFTGYLIPSNSPTLSP